MRRRGNRGDVLRRGAASVLTVRTALVAALAGAAAILVTLPTIGTVFARRNAAVAVAFWPWGAEGNAALASGLVSGEVATEGDQSSRIGRGRMLAARALDRQPISAMAAGVMAIADIAQNREHAAVRALAFGERLSRRDIATQLVLIERAVNRGNIDEALRHYDRALRTTARAPDLLFPVLVPAADQPAITRPLARLLATRPTWWLPFTLQLVQQSREPAALVTILGAERLRMSAPSERTIAITGMKRLVALGRVDLAGQLADQWQGRGRGLVANPDFTRPMLFPPFDWDLASGEDGGPAIEDAPGGGRALLLTTGSDGGGGVVARQLVRLPVGRYRFAVHTDGLSADGSRPSLSVACVTGTILGSKAAAAASGGERGDGLSFDVPTGCAGQWIAIGVVPGSDAAAPPPLVRTVSLMPDAPARSKR